MAFGSKRWGGITAKPGSVWLLPLALTLFLGGCGGDDRAPQPAAASTVRANIDAFTIGTGSPTGVYFPAGKAICKAFKESSAGPSYGCTAKNTGGSIYNIDHVQSGDLELGIAQADTLHRAWSNEPPFKEAADKLRVLFALHDESVTMVVHKKSGVTSLGRMRGKRINVGPKGSGGERIVAELMSSCKIFPGDMAQLGRLKNSEMPEALKKRQMDGYFYVVGHPNANVANVAASIPLEILPLNGGCVDSIVKEKPYFDHTSVPGGLYRGVGADVPTFGVRAWLVSSADIPEEAVYELVKAFFEKMDVFRRQHPTFYRLSPRKMLKKFSVPYHAGALRYYMEKGWFVL